MSNYASIPPITCNCINRNSYSDTNHLSKLWYRYIIITPKPDISIKLSGTIQLQQFPKLLPLYKHVHWTSRGPTSELVYCNGAFHFLLLQTHLYAAERQHGVSFWEERLLVWLLNSIMQLKRLLAQNKSTITCFFRRIHETFHITPKQFANNCLGIFDKQIAR